MGDGDGYKEGRSFVFRLPHGSDILEFLTGFCAKRKVRAGTVRLIGATSEVTLGYYDQVSHDYHTRSFRQEMEILSCIGNVSLKGGKPFLHLHASMGDTELRVWGGHLFPGSKVFSAEACVTELLGPELSRKQDPQTGLHLWSCPA